MAKGRLKSEKSGERATVQRVLAGVLDAILRLVQPVMPFVAESIWQALNEAAFERGLPGPGARDFERCHRALAGISKRMARRRHRAAFRTHASVGLRAVREIRNHYNVDPRSELDVSVRCPETTAADFRSLQTFIKTLAGVATLTTGPAVVKPPQAASHVTPDFEVYVSLKGLIDVAAELKRLEKQLAEKRKFAQALEAKLANEAFVSRAPADVVQQQREQLADLHKQIATMEANLRELNAG